MEAEQTKEIMTKESETEKTVIEDSGTGESGKADKEDSGTSFAEKEDKPRAEEAKEERQKTKKSEPESGQEVIEPRQKSQESAQETKGTEQEMQSSEQEMQSSEQKMQSSEQEMHSSGQKAHGPERETKDTGQETQGSGQETERKKTSKRQSRNTKGASGSGPIEKREVKQESISLDEGEKVNKSAAEETQVNEETDGKKRRPGKPVFAAALTVMFLLAACYLGIAFFYRTHFLPNTSINGAACGNLNAASVTRLIDAQILDYSLAVTGRDYATGEAGTLLGTIRAEDIELTYADTAGAVEHLLKEQNQFLWPAAYLGRKQESYSLVQGVTFSEEKLKETVEAWDACQKKNMTPPEDAYIGSYSDEINGYEIVFEQPGTELDMGKTIQCITEKLNTHEATVDLEEMLCYTEANVKGTDKELADAVEKANTWLSTRVLYDWNGNEVLLDGETLRDWVTIEEGEPKLDEDAVAGFVKRQAKEFDTYGKRKKFTTALGVELSLKSPNYGWKTDVEAETEELLQLIYQGGDVEKEPNYSARGQEKGVNDVGNSYIEADLTHQHLYVHQDGAVVLETDFVSGKMNSTPGCVTPEGIFGLSYKTTNAVLRGADYETPVNYWMPFFGNYGMHDATWRANFGGTIYIEHGSHGCINLPLSAASQIYEYVFKGSPVVCYYYEVDPLSVPVEGPALTEEELLSQEEPTLSGNTGQEPAPPQDQTQ